MTDSLAIKVIEDRLRQLAKERDEAVEAYNEAATMARKWIGKHKEIERELDSIKGPMRDGD